MAVKTRYQMAASLTRRGEYGSYGRQSDNAIFRRAEIVVQEQFQVPFDFAHHVSVSGVEFRDPTHQICLQRRLKVFQ